MKESQSFAASGCGVPFTSAPAYMAVVFWLAGMSTWVIGFPACSWNIASECDTCVGTPLHQKQWCLTMVDMGEDGAAVGHLGLVDRVGERLPASLLQRRLDLPRDSLEFGVGHGETDIGFS